MNNLNTILIEGEIVEDTRLADKDQKLALFTIASRRQYKDKNGIAEEVNCIDIESSGKLAEHFMNIGRKGRGIRVVGRMRQRKGEPAVIVAEHIEFKPEFVKKPLEAYTEGVSE